MGGLWWTNRRHWCRQVQNMLIKFPTFLIQVDRTKPGRPAWRTETLIIMLFPHPLCARARQLVTNCCTWVMQTHLFMSEGDSVCYTVIRTCLSLFLNIWSTSSTAKLLWKIPQKCTYSCGCVIIDIRASLNAYENSSICDGQVELF